MIAKNHLVIKLPVSFSKQIKDLCEAVDLEVGHKVCDSRKADKTIDLYCDEEFSVSAEMATRIILGDHQWRKFRKEAA